jgi:peptidoglycan hydrolase-like protein with peptidoglycan-binding domain
MKKILLSLFVLSFVAMPAVTNAGFFDWFRIDFGGQRAEVRSSIDSEVLRRGARSEEIAYLQNRLKDAGFYSGWVSGVFGRQTETAVRNWQRKNDLTSTGRLDKETRKSIAGLLPSVPNTRVIETTYELKVFLGGAYNPATGLMSTSLNDQNLIPLIEPYTELGYSPDNNYAEIESSVLDATGNDAIVDWVIVETRSNTEPMETLFSEAALIQADGDIVGLDGTSPLSYQLINGPTYFVIKHRNHLPIMNAEEILMEGGVNTQIDFTNMSLFGTNSSKVVNGAQVMWPGDVNGDSNVIYAGEDNDKDVILSNLGDNPNDVESQVYMQSDINMDGQVKYTGTNNDRDIILQTVGSTTPNAVLEAGIPEKSHLIANWISSEYAVSSEVGESDTVTYEIKFELVAAGGTDIQIPHADELVDGIQTNGEGFEFGFNNLENLNLLATNLICENCENILIPGGYNIDEDNSAEFTLTVVAQPETDGYYNMYLNSINWSETDNVSTAENFYTVSLGQTSNFVTDYSFLNAI